MVWAHARAPKRGLGGGNGGFGGLGRVLVPWVAFGEGCQWALRGQGGSLGRWGGAVESWGCPGCLGPPTKPTLPAGKEYAKADSRYMT